jgi:hypothetical protein
MDPPKPRLCSPEYGFRDQYGNESLITDHSGFRVSDAAWGVPFGVGWAAEWEFAAALKSQWLLRWAWQ